LEKKRSMFCSAKLFWGDLRAGTHNQPAFWRYLGPKKYTTYDVRSDY
jgi:hypothetical protein